MRLPFACVQSRRAAATDRLHDCTPRVRAAPPERAVDPLIALAVVMLAVWAAGTWFDGPGWIHLLLTLGVFLLVWRVVTRAQPKSGDSSR